MSVDAMNPQVLVVGAGPVGLTMAAELARYGIAVRIVDKAAGETDADGIVDCLNRLARQ
jgi:2-polyprenyl-6-methoxyphenol hydroxylase-like FAD-dependent oxidoreductase